MAMNGFVRNSRSSYLSILILAMLIQFGCAAPVLQPQDVEPEETKKANPEYAGVPVWTVGERWEYSDGYALEVESVSTTNGVSIGDNESYPPEERLTRFKVTPPNGYSWKPWNDSWMVFKGFFKVESKMGGEHRKVIYVSEKPDKLFPLAKGKEVNYNREFLRNGVLIKHRSSWRVTGYQEKVTVGNDDFGCWILEWNTDSLSSNWSGHETLWYCPEIKNYARIEFRYGENESSTRVLINYHKPSKRDKIANSSSGVNTLVLPMEPNRD
ncbi:MAG: hypothetical protein HQL89_10475 [Magnetococcales bacterium]|nr:hypothetical protein [Magnetococcales bacterium]